ncbi:MAG: MgtC/SapB family protein [Spirochaetales bacterium]|nr:MgtC/SapB family protein [Spirochaetales bacterium]
MDFNTFLFLPELINSNILFRLLAAFLLSFLVGMERDIHGRPAGLRTNILVALGSCTFTVLSIFICYNRRGIQIADPSRIAAQIITGIGFIGAGAILKQGFNIKGLTTAASLWISAAIGMACGSGYIELGIFCTVFSLVTLQLLDRLERHFPRDIYKKLEIRSVNNTDFSAFIRFLSENNITPVTQNIRVDYETNQATYLFWLRLRAKRSKPVSFDEIQKALTLTVPEIYSASWSD